ECGRRAASKCCGGGPEKGDGGKRPKKNWSLPPAGDASPASTALEAEEAASGICRRRCHCGAAHPGSPGTRPASGTSVARIDLPEICLGGSDSRRHHGGDGGGCRIPVELCSVDHLVTAAGYPFLPPTRIEPLAPPPAPP